MAKSKNYTTPKRAANGPKKNNNNNSNTQLRKVKVVTVPQTKTVRGTGPTRLSQQELVLQVKAGAGQFVLHPSNIPWLAAVAPSHQEWCLANLRVWYEPRVGTTTSGTVSAALLEDFADTAPPSLTSITRLSGSQRGAPWTPFVLSAPRNRWVPYASKASFDSMPAVEKSGRSLGRIVTFADVDTAADVVLGNIFISYNPASSLRLPTDPTLQQ